MMSKQQPKTTKEEFPQKRQLKAANCLYQKSRASNTTTKALTRNGPGTTGFLTDKISVVTKYQSLSIQLLRATK